MFNRRGLFKARKALPMDSQQLEIGLMMVREQHYMDALKQFRNVINHCPRRLMDILTDLYKELLTDFENLDIRLLISEIYIQAGMYNDALLELEEAFDINPGFTRIYIQLRRLYNRKFEKDTISQMFETAFGMAIYDTAVLDILPQIYLERNDLEKGVVFYEKLLARYPEKIMYYKALSELYMLLGLYDQAAGNYQRLWRAIPESQSEVVQMVAQLVEKVPDHIPSRHLLIELLQASGQVHQIVPHIQMILELNQDYLLPMIQLYNDLLARYPHTQELIFALAHAYTLAERYTEAVAALENLHHMHHDLVEPQIIQLLEVIIQKFPTQYTAIKRLAEIRFKQHKIEMVMQLLTQLVDLIDEKVDTEDLTRMITQCRSFSIENEAHSDFLLARVYLIRNQLEACLEKCRKLQGSAFDLESRFLAISVHEKQEQWGTLSNEIFTAIQRYPYHPVLHKRICNLNLELINREIQRKPMTEANGEVSPKDRYQLGLLQLRKGAIYPALEQFQAIPEGDSLKQKSQLLIGRCFMELDRFDLATSQMTRILDMIPTQDLNLANQIRFLIAMNLINAGQEDKAMQYLNNILEYNVAFPKIQSIIARYKEFGFSDTRGRTIGLTKSLTEDKAWSMVAIPYRDERDKTVRRGTKKTDWLNVSFAYVHNNQAVDYFFQENYKAAEETFKFALQMDPSLQIAHCNLAVLHLIRGEYDAALNHIREAQAINPKMDMIYLILGNMFLMQNEIKLAREQFMDVLVMNPDNFLAMINLGDIHYQLGECERAFHFWRQAWHYENVFYQIQRRIRYLEREGFGFKHWINDYALPFIDLSSDAKRE